MEFKAGDKVKCIREFEHNSDIVGMIGIIHKVYGYTEGEKDFAEVDWGEYGEWNLPLTHIQKVSTKLKLINKGNKLQF